MIVKVCMYLRTLKSIEGLSLTSELQTCQTFNASILTNKIPSLLDIPPEIASAICEYLPKCDDLRMFKWQNRVFDIASGRVTFRRVHLKVNLASFERL